LKWKIIHDEILISTSDKLAVLLVSGLMNPNGRSDSTYQRSQSWHNTSQTWAIAPCSIKPAGRRRKSGAVITPQGE